MSEVSIFSKATGYMSFLLSTDGLAPAPRAADSASGKIVTLRSLMSIAVFLMSSCNFFSYLFANDCNFCICKG